MTKTKKAPVKRVETHASVEAYMPLVHSIAIAGA